MTIQKLKNYVNNLPEEIEDPGGVIYDLAEMICKLPNEQPSTPTEQDYWKKRCEAAEMVLDTFPSSVLQDQAEEIYMRWVQLKNNQP